MCKKDDFIVPHKHTVSYNERIKLNGHKALVVWFTGLSGSGKSTIANGVEQKLFEQGLHTYLLDGDNVRTGLNLGLDFSEEGRNENLRRIAEVCKLFLDAGVIVLASFISPLFRDREMIKNIIGQENFIEVFIDTPIAICEQRDVKGLYKKARKGLIKNFTGVSSPYEPPANPDIIVETEKYCINDAVKNIVEYLTEIKKIKDYE